MGEKNTAQVRYRNADYIDTLWSMTEPQMAKENHIFTS